MQSYSDLPPEIMFDILSLLPAKLIGLCRCVSKSWRALLTQPNFIKTHLQLTKINSLAIIHRSNHGSTIYSAPLNNADDQDKITLSVTKLSFSPSSWYVIYGSCDGLLLVSDGYSKLLVMNPITREIRQVPHSWLSYGYLSYGFGYDSVNDDYKIVIISYLYAEIHGIDTLKEMFVGVYSLKTGYWKRLESPPYDFVGHSRESAFLNDSLHWLARRTKDNKQLIVAFNLIDEKFLEIPLPDLIPNILDVDYLSCYKLDVLADCLCLYVPMMVFVMKEYGVKESWTKLSKSNIYGLFKCALNDQEQVVIKLIYPAGGYTMWNSKQGTLKEIVFNGFDEDPNNIYSVEVGFVESLVSPYNR